MNRPLNFSPSQSFIFLRPRRPSVQQRHGQCNRVCPCTTCICVCNVASSASFLSDRKSGLNAKGAKKVPLRSFVSPSLSLASRRPLRNNSSPRSGLHTSSTSSRSRASQANERADLDSGQRHSLSPSSFSSSLPARSPPARPTPTPSFLPSFLRPSRRHLHVRLRVHHR